MVMEYFTSNNYTHLNTVNRIEDWSETDIKVIVGVEQLPNVICFIGLRSYSSI